MPKKKDHSWLPRTSIRERTVRQFVFFIVGVITTLTITVFLVASSIVEQRVLSQLTSESALREDGLERSINADRERTSLLTGRSDFRNILRVRGGDSVLDDLRLSLEGDDVLIIGMHVFDTEDVLVATSGNPIGPSTGPVGITYSFPRMDENGRMSHVVYSPIRDRSSVLIGYLAIEYNLETRMSQLRDIASIGDSGEVLVGVVEDDELILLEHGYSGPEGGRIILGDMREFISYNSPVALAVAGKEGLGVFTDYRGKKVYASYRTMPTFGWGLVVKIDFSDARKGAQALAFFMTIAGALFAVGSGVIAYSLSRRLTDPIRKLGRKFESLGPDHWSARHTVHTGDEIELLDRKVVDMAKRLKDLYGNLEREVEKRTVELKQQYIKEHAILETIEHGVIAVDKDGLVTDINKSALAMLRMDEVSTVGCPIENVLLVCNHGEMCSHKDNPVTIALRKRKLYKANLGDHVNIVRDDKTLLPVSIEVTPLLEGKKTLGAIAVFQDISEDRRMDYIKSEFISLASHQLRTPISMIGWYIEILNNDRSVNLSKVQKESIKEMHAAVQRMNALVDTLLRTARLEGGAIEPQFGMLNIQKLIDDLVQELKTYAKEKKVACSAVVPKGAVNIQTDPVLIRIVFQNLFSNAVKYSKEGCDVEVGLKKKGSHVELTVSDSGIGIPERDQEMIFKRFYRAHNATSIDVDGNGLGLYISKLIIEMLGGTIRFKSKEGEGSVFTVKLPLKKKSKRSKGSK